MSPTSSYQPFGAPAEPPLTPFAKGCLWLAGFLALLLIGVVVNYLLHGGTEGLNPVAQAAEETAATPGSRVRMEITYTVAGSSRTVTGNGGGVFDSKSGRARVTLSVPAADGTTVESESRGDARTVYVRSSALAAQLPAGRQWLEMEPLLGHDPETAFGDNGAQGTLGMLEATSGGVEEVDHESVHGHLTTRYRAKVAMSEVAQLARERGKMAVAREYEAIAAMEPDPIPVEVWVDESGLARLVRITEPLSASSGLAMTMDMRMEFFYFGPQKKVALPPRGQVFDYTPVMRAELGMLDGTNFGPLGPPAGSAPLSVAAFHRRTAAICRSGEAYTKSWMPRERELTEKLKALGPGSLSSGAAKPLLQATGRWYEVHPVPVMRRLLARMAALAPPARYASDYRRYLRLNAEQGEWFLVEARELQVGVLKLNSEAHKTEKAAQKEERKKLASSLGIPACEKESGSGSSSQAA